MSSTRQKLVPRKAELTPEHISHIMHYLEKFHSKSPWKDVDLDWDKLANFVYDLIEGPNSEIFIHEEGILLAFLSNPFFAAPSHIIAQELVWYADRDGPELLEAFEQWGKEKGANMTSLSSLFYGRRVDHKYSDFYNKLGYKPMEASYTKEVD